MKTDAGLGQAAPGIAPGVDVGAEVLERFFQKVLSRLVGIGHDARMAREQNAGIGIGAQAIGAGGSGGEVGHFFDGLTH